jgi:hypothetical protein
MPERLNRFVAISEVLTGFTSTGLWATGEVVAYLEEMDAVVSQTVVDDLLSRFGVAISDTKDLNEVVAEGSFAALPNTPLVAW